MAVAAGPHVEKGGGVGIVSDPAGHGDVVVALVLGGHIGPEGLLFDVDADAELLECLLHGFHRGVDAGGQDLVAGQSLAAGITGLGQQLLGLIEIVFQDIGGLVVAHLRGHGNRRFKALEDVFAELFPIQGQAQGLTDLHLVEALAAGVEAQVAGADVGLHAQVLRMVFAGPLEQFGGQAVGGVELASEEGAGLGVEIGDGEEFDAVEANVFRVPVIRVALDFDVVIEAPFHELEGAVADDVFELGPFGEALVDFAVLQNHVFGHGKPGGMARHGGQIGDRFAQGDDQGVGVGCLDADFGLLVEVGFPLVDVGDEAIQDQAPGGLGNVLGPFEKRGILADGLQDWFVDSIQAASFNPDALLCGVEVVESPLLEFFERFILDVGIAAEVDGLELLPGGGEVLVQAAEEVAALVLIVGLGVFDDMQHARILCRQSRVEHPAVGKEEVIGGDRLAVRPPAFRLQVEGPLGHVLVVLPAGSRTGDHGVVLGGVVAAEALKQAGEHLALRDPRGQLSVEALGFRATGVEQNALAGGFFHRRLGIAAGQQPEGEERGDGGGKFQIWQRLSGRIRLPSGN